LADLARNHKEKDFNDTTREEIKKSVKQALNKNPKLLIQHEGTAVLMFKMSYSEIVKILGINA